MRKSHVWLLLLAYLTVLFVLTLGSLYQPNPSRNLVPFRTIALDLQRGGKPFVINILGNLAAFLPMGVLPVWLWKRSNALTIAGLSFGLSLIIEVAQWESGRRVADVDDLILNTLGGLIGYGYWVLIRSDFHQKA